jgi:hypothetical protein
MQHATCPTHLIWHPDYAQDNTPKDAQFNYPKANSAPNSHKKKHGLLPTSAHPARAPV